MNVNAAIELLLALIANSQAISTMIQTARAEGRDEFTPEEWDSIVAADDAASKRLQDAIAAAQARRDSRG